MDRAKIHLKKFYGRFGADRQMTCWHLTLYIAIFYLWQTDGIGHTVQISRKKLMELSRINSIATYHKCIRQLVLYGYIDYTPSYHPMHGSLVRLLLAD